MVSLFLSFFFGFWVVLRGGEGGRELSGTEGKQGRAQNFESENPFSVYQTTTATGIMQIFLVVWESKRIRA